MDITFGKLIIRLRLSFDCSDPYALFRLRGNFQEAFRAESGCRTPECRACRRSTSCSFFHAFGQSLSSDPLAVRRYQKPPVPFAFDLPLLPPVPNRGIEFEIGLTIVGSALNFCGEYLRALRVACARHPSGLVAEIVDVASEGYTRERQPVHEGEDGTTQGLTLLSFSGVSSVGTVLASPVSLSLGTPLRLMHQGQLLRDFRPSIFLKAVMRRVTSLAYYYGETELHYDFKWLAAQSEKVSSLDASFHWCEWTRSLSGIAGEGVLTGPLEDFLPFLHVGRYVHVGKSASFGFGKYDLGYARVR